MSERPITREEAMRLLAEIAMNRENAMKDRIEAIRIHARWSGRRLTEAAIWAAIAALTNGDDQVTGLKRSILGHAFELEICFCSCAKPRYLPAIRMELQIAEGMLTFFENYERELEKYRTKTLFFQLSSGIPPLP